MAHKFDIGVALPRVTLNVVSGGTIAVPDELDARYRIVLFYRGHW